MKIYLKSREEIARLREANLVVAAVLDAVEAAARPGVSTYELDLIAAKQCKHEGATPAFLGYHGYPAVLCTSINDEVVHGIPRKDRVLKDGDILSVDFGAFKHGFCGDSARTLAIGTISAGAQKLITATREALDQAIAVCRADKRLQDIGWAVQSHVETLGFSVVRSFVGHGIGQKMHEDPPVPNYGAPGRGLRLKPGLVLAVEPMVNAGGPDVEVLEDRWTAVTKDRSLSAHFEHSVVITDGEPLVLSRP
ncbi:MAG TPA: type I methionyl aminopeptidase [Polyangia bacterium]|jgi:methionyl aminopeptidase